MEKDRLIEEIERSLGGGSAGAAAGTPLPETEDDPPDPSAAADPADPYEQALADLRAAASEFERAGQALAAAQRQLALYPAPLLRPALRLVQFAALVAVAAAHPVTLEPDWRFGALPCVLAFAAASAGELTGTGLAGTARQRGFMAESGALLATVCGAAMGAAIIATALVLPLPWAAEWFSLAVSAIFLASAATLPFLPIRAAEQARLEERARAAHARQAKAFAAAREASERLERIHAGHLAGQPLAPQTWGRNAYKK